MEARTGEETILRDKQNTPCHYRGLPDRTDAGPPRHAAPEVGGANEPLPPSERGGGLCRDSRSRSEKSGGSFHSAPRRPAGSQEDC